MRHVQWVLSMPAHPLRERLMMVQQGGVVAAYRQTIGLGLRRQIQQTDGKPVEPDCRRRRCDLTRRHGIAGKQQVSPVRL